MPGKALGAVLAAALLIGTGSLPVARAQTGDQSDFDTTDLNHDGFVTYEEAERVFYGLKRVQFVKCDIDGDGALDKGEFPLLNNFYWLVDER